MENPIKNNRIPYPNINLILTFVCFLKTFRIARYICNPLISIHEKDANNE
jgi:hypothetical protein